MGGGAIRIGERPDSPTLVKAVLGHVSVRDLVTSRPAPVDPAASVFDVGERMIRERRTVFPVVADGDRVAVVTLEEVQRVPAGDRRHVRAAEVARRARPVQARDEASAAMRALAESGGSAVPVYDDGSLYGLLSQRDILRGLQLSELEATQPPTRGSRESAGDRASEPQGR
jgi:CBS domain-containing protein